MLKTSPPLNPTFLFFFFLLLLLSTIPTCNSSSSSSPPLIGVTYSPPPSGRRRPSPEQIPAAISSLKIDCLRLQDPDPALVRAFSYSNTTLLLSIPNPAVAAVAADIGAAADWLRRHVVPFYPRSHISTISVGTDLLSSPHLLLPAMTNTRLSLLAMGLPRISVSTTLSFSAVVSLNSSSSPPSAAVFRRPLAGTLITPLLHFLRSTNSCFLVKLYPYEAYMADAQVPLGFALFQEEAFGFRDDPRAGVRYRNLFDMMVGAVVRDIKATGHGGGVRVVVAETGWPVGSGEGEATPVYAEMYIRGLVRHLRSPAGTGSGVAEVYVNQLVDGEEEEEGGGGRRWGILHANMSRKYSFEFSESVRVMGGEGGGGLMLRLLLLLVLMLVDLLVWW